jgi:hypothetical protein
LTLRDTQIITQSGCAACRVQTGSRRFGCLFSTISSTNILGPFGSLVPHRYRFSSIEYGSVGRNASTVKKSTGNHYFVSRTNILTTRLFQFGLTNIVADILPVLRAFPAAISYPIRIYVSTASSDSKRTLQVFLFGRSTRIEDTQVA